MHTHVHKQHAATHLHHRASSRQREDDFLRQARQHHRRRIHLLHGCSDVRAQPACGPKGLSPGSLPHRERRYLGTQAAAQHLEVLGAQHVLGSKQVHTHAHTLARRTHRSGSLPKTRAYLHNRHTPSTILAVEAAVVRRTGTEDGVHIQLGEAVFQQIQRSQLPAGGCQLRGCLVAGSAYTRLNAARRGLFRIANAFGSDLDTVEE